VDALEAIASRRSVRRFASREVAVGLVGELVEAACAAPAPHHSRPWRFVRVRPETRPRLAEAMAEAWRADLEDGADEAAVARSGREIVGAPVLLLACLDLEGAREWPDERRRMAERDMFVQSLGAALQNLLLAAHAKGLAGYLKGAPLFCREAVAAALELPAAWEPAFLVLLGYAEEGAAPPPRPPAAASDFLVDR
jgi:coenzyme F420-0:L-glutamate ligase/coenzyme F420-1:gamma-L-glutamate ligase